MAGPSDEPRLDCWADWLVRGRQRGMSERQMRRLARQLARVRNRVLRGGKVRRGAGVLDIGAGTGLLALEAARRTGQGGRVVASDISSDALAQALRSAAQDGARARVDAAVCDATFLPFRDAAFDAVFTRSVLIFVADKGAAVREMHRVLRARGRVSIFEPINSVDRGWQAVSAQLDAARDEYERVNAYRDEHWDHRATMLDFDERDLVRHFADAGFSSVRLEYEYGVGRRKRRPAEVALALAIRPNPSLMSYEEAARVVLHEAADAHLAALAREMAAAEFTGAQAAAYITAAK